jgi:hypothetical protein
LCNLRPKGEVERHLTGKETEPSETIYFRLYNSQLPIVEKTVETAALRVGTDKSRGYCLEMICADFLAGANAQDEEPLGLGGPHSAPRASTADRA